MDFYLPIKKVKFQVLVFANSLVVCYYIKMANIVKVQFPTFEVKPKHIPLMGCILCRIPIIRLLCI